MTTGPHFIGLGMQKSGSSFLFNALSRHPDIRFPVRAERLEGLSTNIVDGVQVNTLPKEVHFLKGRNSEMSWEQYLSLFETDDPTTKTGEITPLYASASVERIRELKDHCPDVRLFAVIRHPVARDWSAIRMIGARQGVLEDDDALERIANIGQIHMMGDYAPMLENWLSVFDRSSLWFEQTERMKIHPEKILTSLFQHLDVDPARLKKELPGEVHKGPEKACPPRIHALLAERHAGRLGRLMELTGLEFSQDASLVG